MLDTYATFQTETVPIAALIPHPRNYREHPADQIAHLVASITAHGLYRPFVLARDNTILVGHGLRLALLHLGWTEAPAVRLDLDPLEPAALALLVGDNEIGHLAEVDDRALTEMLKEVKAWDADALLGTGYDGMMLANLAFVTRPATEIADHNEAAQWVGMPEYAPRAHEIQVMIRFRTEADRAAFLQMLSLPVMKKNAHIYSAWWPPKEIDDASSMRFEVGNYGR